MAEDSPLRIDPRAPIELKVEYKKLNAFFADYTKNISKGGTFIETRNPLELGTIFMFKLFLPNVEQSFDLKGEVVWTNSETRRMRMDLQQFGMGIRFIFDDPKKQTAFKEHVEQMMADSLGELLYKKLMNVSKKTKLTD